jgi:hypothetical protein
MFSDLKNSAYLNGSSFIDGFKHYSYYKANNKYRDKLPDDVIQAIVYLPTPAAFTYYLGRTVRFVVAVPGTLADIILQLFQSVTASFEALANKFEMLLTNKKEDQTFFCDFPITELLISLRLRTTSKEPWILAADLRIKNKFPNEYLVKKSVQVGLIYMLYRSLINKITT